MDQRFTAVAALSTVLAFSTPAAAQEDDGVLTFSPNGPWNVDFADDFCALRRSFKSGEDLASLELKQYVPGHGFDLLFLAQGIEEPKGEVSYRFLPHDDLIEPILRNAVRSGDGVRGLFMTGKFGPASDRTAMSDEDLPPQPPDGEIDSWAEVISKLRFEEGFDQKIDVETGPLDEATTMMRSCMSGLIETWGIDPESLATRLQGVKPKNQMRWARMTQESYPTEALRKGIGGSVRVRVIVGADGKPSSCLSQQSFSAEILQRAACDAAMKYAQFEPALDKDGEPVVGYFLTRITYSPH